VATKASVLKEANNNELELKLKADREELFRLRFQLATRQLGNPMRIRTVRKEIARILTILRERELASAPAQEG
jgi:large subunit ribosomal protein L29